MTVRRPDERTVAQRAAQLNVEKRELFDRAAAALRAYEGSARRDVRAVYVQEVRRGTSCKVLMP
jgi:hypothetical protein